MVRATAGTLAIVPTRRSASGVAFVLRYQMAYQFPMVHRAVTCGAKSRLNITAIDCRFSAPARLNVYAGEYLFTVRGFAVRAVAAGQRVFYTLSSFASLAVVDHCALCVGHGLTVRDTAMACNRENTGEVLNPNRAVALLATMGDNGFVFALTQQKVYDYVQIWLKRIKK